MCRPAKWLTPGSVWMFDHSNKPCLLLSRNGVSCSNSTSLIMWPTGQHKIPTTVHLVSLNPLFIQSSCVSFAWLVHSTTVFIQLERSSEVHQGDQQWSERGGWWRWLWRLDWSDGSPTGHQGQTAHHWWHVWATQRDHWVTSVLWSYYAWWSAPAARGTANMS